VVAVVVVVVVVVIVFILFVCLYSNNIKRFRVLHITNNQEPRTVKKINSDEYAKIYE
jgi:uncharacterized ion transporter superfamily protein YfcC